MAAAVTKAAVVVLLLAVVAAGDDGATTTHLSFFMHDIVSGSNPTAVKVIKGPGPATAATLGMAFGDTTVVDDALTEASSASSAEVGRAQGIYMLSSQSGAAPALMVCANLLLTTGDHNGSTVAVLGRDDTGADVRELSVVGGTGKYRMATGYVLWRTSGMSGADATVKLDVYLTTGGGGGNGTTIDAGAPVSPVDGGSSGSGSSSGTKANGAVRTTGAGGWVAAVVVAVVGSSWVW